MSVSASSAKPTPRYSPEELERQYSISAARPDFNARVVPDWERRSAAFRQSCEALLDRPYGVRARERLDVFGVSGRSANAPTLIFFHGGYWQRFDKSVFSFVAAPFVAAGIPVVLAGYDLCPDVRIGKIVDQARRAFAYLWDNAGELGLSRDRLFVAGHSAGGHLAAMVMATEWPRFSPRLPPDLVKGAVPISGLFDLEPIRHTSVNDALDLDEEEVWASSPVHHALATEAPQLIAVGALESDEFHRQSDLYVETFATPARQLDRYRVPGCDHCDVLSALADPASEFFAKALEFITRE